MALRDVGSEFEAASGLFPYRILASRALRVNPFRLPELSCLWPRLLRTPRENVIEEASRLGVRGVDILHRQMECDDLTYIRALARMKESHLLSRERIAELSGRPNIAEKSKKLSDNVKAMAS